MARLKRIIYTLLLSAGFLQGMAQPTRLFFNHLTINEGLSQGTNHFIYKDSRGFVWFSSQSGLNRFDGQRIRVYKHNLEDETTISGNNIQSSFFEDEEGNIWFSTYEGICCYIREKDTFRRYNLYREDGTPYIGYHIAYQYPKGKLWVIIEGDKLFQFIPEEDTWNFRIKMPLTQRMTPLYDNSSKLVGIAGFLIDSPGVQIYDVHNNLRDTSFHISKKEHIPQLHPNELLAVGDSALWIAAKEGLFAYNLQRMEAVACPLIEGTPSGLAFYGKNKLLISARRGGLQVLDRETKRIEAQFKYEEKNTSSLAANMANKVYVDPEGGIWVDIPDEGIDFAHPQKVKFSFLDVVGLWKGPGVSKGVFALSEDQDGNIWCSSRFGGIYVISPDLKPITYFVNERNKPKQLPGNDVFYHFFDSQNRCWALTIDGLGVRKADGKYFQSLMDGFFIHGLELRDKRVIFSTSSGGIYIATENETAPEVRLIPEVDKKLVFTNLFQNRNGFLFACENLSRILVMDPDRQFEIIDTLPIKGFINCYYEPPDDNILWIATSNGLVKLDQVTWEYNFITEADGLPNQHVYAILADDSGNLWLTTNKGIAKYSPDNGIIQSFDLSDGIQDFEFNSDSYLRRSNGELWFGGQNGINIFHPDSLSLLPVPPKVKFTKLFVNDQERLHPKCKLTGARNISEINTLEFKYKENTLSFEFAALEYGNPTQNTYRYKMHGYDRDWVPGGNNGFVRYANLPPEAYVFEVVASNSDGIEGESKKMGIIIETPFWMTWWFWFGVFGLIVMVIWRIYQYRLEQLLRLERLRNQISSDLHDDIGATLSNINILITLMRNKLPLVTPASSFLNRIEEEVQTSAESLDDIIWSINPKNDPLDRVFARMRRFASEMFEAKGIIGKVHFPEEAKHLRLDMGKRRQFYLIFKEAINNLTKYAQCTTASISMKYEAGILSLLVKDDGIGISEDDLKKEGNGLRTMQERAEKLQGDFRLETKPGKGTSIYVSFPITETGD